MHCPVPIILSRLAVQPRVVNRAMIRQIDAVEVMRRGIDVDKFSPEKVATINQIEMYQSDDEIDDECEP